MPVKNAAPFLKECIDSILKQEYKSWELIAVNDHSSDESLSILESYQDQRISIQNNPGNGIISALRHAFELSKGQFITRMDADDIMPSNKLLELESVLSQHGKNHVATGKVHYFSSSGISDGFRKYETWLNELIENNNHWEHLYKECVIPSPCWLIHRDDLIKCGAFDPNQYPEDYDLVFRFYQSGFKVCSSDKVLHHWRDYQKRTSRTHSHYADSSFFELKVKYFLKLHHQKERSLVIWGAGSKGKQMAKLLQSENIEFKWVSNNPNKHGKIIHEQILESYTSLIKTEHPQIIITVAQRNARKAIASFLSDLKLKDSLDYYFFN